MTLLKGYSSVNLIHGLTDREIVLDSLSRDQVSAQNSMKVVVSNFISSNA